MSGPRSQSKHFEWSLIEGWPCNHLVLDISAWTNNVSTALCPCIADILFSQHLLSGSINQWHGIFNYLFSQHLLSGSINQWHGIFNYLFYQHLLSGSIFSQLNGQVHVSMQSTVVLKSRRHSSEAILETRSDLQKQRIKTFGASYDYWISSILAGGNYWVIFLA